MAKKAEKKQQETKEETKKISEADYEKKVIELADKGLTAEKIGEELRKKGIHPKEYNKKISKILKDKYINPDLKNAEKKLEKIEDHLKKNAQDKRAKRERSRIFSRIRKIKKYLKKL